MNTSNSNSNSNQSSRMKSPDLLNDFVVTSPMENAPHSPISSATITSNSSSASSPSFVHSTDHSVADDSQNPTTSNESNNLRICLPSGSNGNK